MLVVYSDYERDHKSLDFLESSIRAHVPGAVNFSVAYLDYQRLDEKSYRESLADTLRNGYSKVMPDLLIVASIDALQFIMEFRGKTFPGVPIVFFGLSAKELAEVNMGPGVTGVTGTVGLPGTIDLALRLKPETNAIAVVTGSRNFWWQAAHSEILKHQDKVREIDIVGSPSAQMIDQVSALPKRTAILFQLAPESSTEPAIGAFDVLRAAAQHLPTYSPWHTLCFDYGCVGGAYRDWESNHVNVAKVAARVLNGERPEDIPVVNESDFHVEVDWQALQHWKIPESALPAGSVILYRQPNFWERDRKFIIAAVVLFGVQSLLIVGLLMQRARKRKAEAVLRESEKRFRVMADTTPSLIWMCDPTGKITYLNDQRRVFTGSDPNAGYGHTWTAYVHPDDLPGMQEAVSHALQTQERFSKEYRLRRRDGVYRWLFDVAVPRVNGDGSFAGFIGSAIDVTDQKLAQEALESVSGRLIEAQEKERSRIARDLHDDICQRLALLSMELEQANRNGASPSTKRKLEAIRQHCAEITGDVQSLSHQLHSSKLEYLGIVAAVRAFCKEFAHKHDVSVNFRDENVPAHLPRDVSLCLFRVAQEALHNAVKYSGTTHFSVEVRGTENEVRLMVNDAGAGFDVEDAKRNRGLGLVSMQERVHLVHGRFEVQSKPGAGTRIVAIVPIDAATGPTSPDGASGRTASVTGAA